MDSFYRFYPARMNSNAKDNLRHKGCEKRLLLGSEESFAISTAATLANPGCLSVSASSQGLCSY